MKNLFLARHAKSDWAVEGISDIDRPLNKRGYEDAHRIGAELKKSISGSILIVSSPAIRALTTALIIAREINYDAGKIQIKKQIYEATIENYLKLIAEFDDQYDSVFIFGHNPTTGEVIIELTGTRIKDLPTCSINKIQLKTTSWKDALNSPKELVMQLFPSNLNQ